MRVLSLLPKWRGFLLGAALVLSGGGVAHADTVTVGDPTQPASLPQAIYDAHTKGATDITIAPGTYNLPSGGQNTIVLDSWSDVAVHAPGVTIIFDMSAPRPVMLRNCVRVTWDGGTLLFAEPAFTQGRITAMGSDSGGDYCDWTIDAGYAADVVPTRSTFDVVDQKTRRLKVDTGDWGAASFEQTSPGVFRLHYPAARAANFVVNDWLVTRRPKNTGIVQLAGCEDCTMKNITLENSGFAAFFETGGAGGNHYLNSIIQPGPRPAGATEDELVSCGADGFHSAGMETGPDIEDCVFSGVLLDDCIAIHGSFYRVTQSEGNDVVLQGPRIPFKVGDPLRVADMKGFFAQANITAIQEDGRDAMRVTLDQDLHVPIDHSEDDDKRKGTKASDPAYCGQGYKILRCRLGDTRSRGILVKADNGLVDGCTIEDCGMAGVSIGPEFWWNEAGYCSNVVVSNNRFAGCTRNNGDQASVWIHGDGSIGNRNIAVRGNIFEGCYGQAIITSNWADGVEISGNRIDQAFQLPLATPGNVISLMQSKNVKLLGNLVSNQGPSAGELVGLGDGESATDVQNNDATGISVAPTPPVAPNPAPAGQAQP